MKRMIPSSTGIFADGMRRSAKPFRFEDVPGARLMTWSEATFDDDVDSHPAFPGASFAWNRVVVLYVVSLKLSHQFQES